MALEEEVEGHNGTEVVTSTENLISEVETGVIATPEQHHYIERLKDLQNEVVEGTHTHLAKGTSDLEKSERNTRKGFHLLPYLFTPLHVVWFVLFCVR